MSRATARSRLISAGAIPRRRVSFRDREIVFVNASWAKLMGKPEMAALFTAVGFGQWFGRSRASSSSPEPY